VNAPDRKAGAFTLIGLLVVIAMLRRNYWRTNMLSNTGPAGASNYWGTNWGQY